MPTLNDRQIILRDLKEKILKKLIERQLSLNTSILNIVKDISELLMYQIVLENRYLSPRLRIQRAPSRIDWLLYQLYDDRFRQEFRMNKYSFHAILRMIKSHWVFKSDPRKKQPEPMIQMMVVLERLGTHGNGASVGCTAQSMCISDNFYCFSTIICSVHTLILIYISLHRRISLLLYRKISHCHNVIRD
ncbi:hypothetical protein PHYBLDRAFT_172421 [Phycomyces blakesleeanus NRRL 1555(-)]|uniref:Uncharacterized protein n=1 Tax=Phycomyces blakesleeanus (strain ATCC 8743b / DSM 1359 / FGSC 10004 / NBRC 33097 / NRRL 1555) TaxID=763407 RepID=A0A167KYB4_PHYB8|nr:hypothetical protein PHYBLDRAFT_172421 [Phycomyces blakesleeanus NRRL 1555(-)]OAD69166.1 hypothetical protein PHYBLDRAFT_172421 [Phycomyces blakesleeanus NRRL 1555(-)]|eukprot:XP_018287206.1 hypothetical protein PHYBLDRAFT_172421 [Phycomyces blakesleeanus NRRL 1555(-)]